MRRGLLLLAAVFALASCATQERPEGIVERWLLALNQGSAGEPDHYAPAEVSNAVLPGWERLGPGELDTIEVGHATDRAPCFDRLPIRVIETDGHETEGYAVLQSCPTVSGREIVEFEQTKVPARTFLSEGGRAFGSAPISAWLVAIGTGLAIALLSEGSMRLARPPVTD